DFHVTGVQTCALPIYVKGTFRTKTGDYRFLAGVVSGDSLKLSAFDGSHVYLFMAKVSDSTLEGKFYSGNHSIEEFMGARNEGFIDRKSGVEGKGVDVR